MARLSRRHVMGAALATLSIGAAGGIPGDHLTHGAIDSRLLDEFMAVSRTLTGRSKLDANIGARLLAALESGTPRLTAELPTLGNALAGGSATATQEALALEITQAWYLGMVGKTVVTYEQALAFDAVSDNLSIRSYVGGAPEFWARDPT